MTSMIKITLVKIEKTATSTELRRDDFFGDIRVLEILPHARAPVVMVAPEKGESDPPGLEKTAVNVLATQEKKNDSTWSEIVQNKSELKKSDVVVEEIDGVQTLKVPNNIFENALPLWEDFIVGNFLHS